MKHRILLHTNPCHIKTGLAENARTLLKYLYRTGKYEIAHYCSQTSIADGNLKYTPWKSFGSIPTDPHIINELNKDPGKIRDVQYGSWNIDNVIKEWKPTIYIGSDDCWGFGKSNYMDKPWWNKINSILHITIDSLPVLEQAYEQASLTKNYITWAKFAQKEMKRVDTKYSHVQQIYGAMDIEKFSPISADQKKQLRERFNLEQDITIFLFVGRNQLRKQFVNCIEAFAGFKRQHPNAKAKLWFHTSFSEKGTGWDIPKMAAYYGVPLEDILATYVCKHCGEWFVSPYKGEDLNCPLCKTEKSLITATIVNGVPNEHMKYVYGIADACVSAFSSGGLEYHNVQSLLCGKPLASTNYSCGEDFCEQSFVYKLGFDKYMEHGTNFIKSTTNVSDIKKFYSKVWLSSKKELEEWGNIGRQWAVKTFSIETIGKQWENLFDSLPIVDWDKISLETEKKDPTYIPPPTEDNREWLKLLYANILKMDVTDSDEGLLHWEEKLKNGMKREDIHGYFVSVANAENEKNQNQTNNTFWNFINKNDKKRALFVMKESMGDCLIATQLFESFHEKYPNHDLYVACDPKFSSVFEGNPYIYKILPYFPFMENEMACIGSGHNDPFFHVYFHPGILTQRQLFYLSAT